MEEQVGMISNNKKYQQSIYVEENERPGEDEPIVREAYKMYNAASTNSSLERIVASAASSDIRVDDKDDDDIENRNNLNIAKLNMTSNNVSEEKILVE